MMSKKKKEKKEWCKPEVHVLVRNKPEEAVLAACKNQPDILGPSQINHWDCGASYPPLCAAPCSDITVS
jgi:hypothetical protein